MQQPIVKLQIQTILNQSVFLTKKWNKNKQVNLVKLVGIVKKMILIAVFYTKRKKKLPDQLLVCRIEDL